MLRRLYEEIDYMEDFELKKFVKFLFIISTSYTILFSFWFVLGIIFTISS